MSQTANPTHEPIIEPGARPSEPRSTPTAGTSRADAAAAQMQDLAASLRVYSEEARQWSREHPVATVLGAAALGYLVAKVLK